jgi:hypothetical protein
VRGSSLNSSSAKQGSDNLENDSRFVTDCKCANIDPIAKARMRSCSCSQDLEWGLSEASMDPASPHSPHMLSKKGRG